MIYKDIVLIASGNIEIPPKGYGAVEDIIWNYKIYLEKEGFNVKIVNKRNIFYLIKETIFVDKKILHFHYEPFLIISYLLNKIFFRKNKILWTSHNGYIVGGKESFFYKMISFIVSKFSDSTMVSLSKNMENYFVKKGFKGKKYILQNGIDTKKFLKLEKPKKDIIYLGNINKNKGQELFLQYYNLDKNIDFIGPYIDKNIDLNGNNYLGILTKKEVFEKLGDYKVLVLLTKSEVGTPLVVKEALAAGCSILTSKIGGVNLEKKEFIKIIDINDKEDLKNIYKYIFELLKNNQKYRKEIFDYSKKFDWENIIKKYRLILNKLG